MSEGVTDYYGALALVRGGVNDSTGFFNFIANEIGSVAGAPPTSVSDASLSPWIDPTDGSSGLYYPKGGLTGFLLDVMIRNASDNRASLDNVMRRLYEATYKRGRGFTEEIGGVRSPGQRAADRLPSLRAGTSMDASRCRWTRYCLSPDSASKATPFASLAWAFPPAVTAPECR